MWDMDEAKNSIKPDSLRFEYSFQVRGENEQVIALEGACDLPKALNVRHVGNTMIFFQSLTQNITGALTSELGQLLNEVQRKEKERATALEEERRQAIAERERREQREFAERWMATLPDPTPKPESPRMRYPMPPAQDEPISPGHSKQNQPEQDSANPSQKAA